MNETDHTSRSYAGPMAVSISLESVTSRDAQTVLDAAVVELNRRYGGSDDGPKLLPSELEPPRGLFLVARLDQELVGGVGLRSIGPADELIGEVKRLWVRDDFRRLGIASSLMSSLEQHAKIIGYLQLFLETGWAQPEAQAFYPKHLWQPVEEFPFGAHSHEGAFRFTKVL